MRNIELGSVTLLQSKVVLSLPLFLLASLLFNAGLGVKVRELRQLLHQPFVLVSGLVGNLATPLVCILGLSVALQLWNESEEVQQILVGLALVAAMPIAEASPAWAECQWESGAQSRTGPAHHRPESAPHAHGALCRGSGDHR